MIAKDIVYEMSSKIGEHLLYNQLNAYAIAQKELR